MSGTLFDRAWYQRPSVLWRRPLEFFPMRGMTPAERLNSIVRFVLYVSVAISLYRSDPLLLGAGLAVILVLSIVFAVPPPQNPQPHSQYAQKADRTEEFSARERCTAPTEANPFMNVLANEYMMDKPASCGVTRETLSQSQAFFDMNLPREISDVYHNRASDRQFVTMPVTGHNGTPDTLAFRNFLFSQLAKGPKCK